jgi:hypothetical protein
MIFCTYLLHREKNGLVKGKGGSYKIANIWTNANDKKAVWWLRIRFRYLGLWIRTSRSERNIYGSTTLEESWIPPHLRFSGGSKEEVCRVPASSWGEGGMKRGLGPSANIQCNQIKTTFKKRALGECIWMNVLYECDYACTKKDKINKKESQLPPNLLKKLLNRDFLPPLVTL